MCAMQSVSLHTHSSLRGLHSHNSRSEIFSSHPQQSLLLSRGKQLLYFWKMSGCPLVLKVRVFLSSEHFNLFHSGGLSKVSYLVPYLWFLCCFCCCYLAMDEAFWDVKKEMLPCQQY